MPKPLLKDREISWLAFNHRVLQEADDPTVPFIERIKFLGIFSSNLDEFFRVRVATVRKLIDVLEKRGGRRMSKPRRIHNKIHRQVMAQQARFQEIWLKLLAELEAVQIRLCNERQLDAEQGKFVKEYFHANVLPALVPVMIGPRPRLTDLKDRAIYLVVRMTRGNGRAGQQHALIEIPTDVLPRFVVLPARSGRQTVILLDDIIRYCLEDIFYIFDYDRFGAWTIKLTRDADITLDNDLSSSLIEKISKSVKQRKKGRPVRFIYDGDLPPDLLQSLIKSLDLSFYDPLIPGARYHNFKDFMKFPQLGGRKLLYPALVPSPHREILPRVSLFSIVEEKDLLVHYPYQSFDHLIRFLREAAIDPEVTAIKMTLYRAAHESRVVNALINAVRNGKRVTAVVELQARFDEEHNIALANRLAEEGAQVIYSKPGLKVHCKLAMVTKVRDGKTLRYCNLSTGNYNEGTAQLYCDHAMFTSDPRITRDVAQVFEYLEGRIKSSGYGHLWVAPHYLRKELLRAIRKEIKVAEAGAPASIVLKVNSLVDEEVIAGLYEAGRAGVKVRIIARGICCLIPGLAGMSENIEAISIVDKFLEHARVFVFGNGGKTRVYLSSADLMPRNLDYRVEVAWPVLDEGLRQELRDILELQWQDNTKARVLNRAQNNRYRRTPGPRVRAQEALSAYLTAKHPAPPK
jgi:polyphosphate kinase